MHVTKRFHAEDMEMNLTPMIDVVFQLIIFFLVVSEIASYDRIEGLTLPQASAAREERVLPDRLVISVVSKGTEVDRATRIEHLDPKWYRVGINKKGQRAVFYRNDTALIARQPKTLKQIERYLKYEKEFRGAGDETKQPVLIQADQYVEWQTVQGIMERASRQGFWKLSFSVKLKE